MIAEGLRTQGAQCCLRGMKLAAVIKRVLKLSVAKYENAVVIMLFS